MGTRSDTQTPVSDNTDENTPPIPETDRFHLLQASRRRKAIRYLLETDESVRVADLARRIAANEYETSITEVTKEQYQRVYIPLYQSHLPRLEESDVIEYDKSRGVIRPTDRLDVFLPYLEPHPSRDENAQRTAGQNDTYERDVVDSYIVATGLSGFLLIAVTMELLSIPGTVLGAFIILIFLAATAVARRQLATAKSS